MLDFALRKARELALIQKTYSLNGSATRKCEKEFLWHCKEFVKKNITVLDLPREAATEKAMLGTFIRRDNGDYDIILNPHMDEKTRRFVLCKELFHVIFDQEMFHNLNLRKHIEITLFTRHDGEIPAHAGSEYLTYAAAAEFLFPHQHRLVIKENGRRDDLKNLSEQYDIPDWVIDFCLSEPALSQYALEE